MPMSVVATLWKVLIVKRLKMGAVAAVLTMSLMGVSAPGASAALISKEVIKGPFSGIDFCHRSVQYNGGSASAWCVKHDDGKWWLHVLVPTGRM